MSFEQSWDLHRVKWSFTSLIFFHLHLHFTSLHWFFRKLGFTSLHSVKVKWTFTFTSLHWFFFSEASPSLHFTDPTSEASLARLDENKKKKKINCFWPQLNSPSTLFDIVRTTQHRSFVAARCRTLVTSLKISVHKTRFMRRSCTCMPMTKCPPRRSSATVLVVLHVGIINKIKQIFNSFSLLTFLFPVNFTCSSFCRLFFSILKFIYSFKVLDFFVDCSSCFSSCSSSSLLLIGTFFLFLRWLKFAFVTCDCERNSWY